MKRYEQAKKQGLNWQVVLIQDLETDIKLATLEAVRGNERFEKVNDKISAMVDKELKHLDSATIRETARPVLLRFASRMYLQWLSIYGNKALALAVIGAMAVKGVTIPPKVKTRLMTLPPPQEVKKIIDGIPPQPNIPDYAYNRATANETYDKEYGEQVIDRVNHLLDEQAKEDYSERYSLRASAERQVRQEWHEQQLNDLKEKGVELVWIEEHANCSERCQPWQGKLYSLNGTSGNIDGISYQPLENATDIYYTTKTGVRYKNGCISGFNCRHRLKPYTKGSHPEKIPANVLERQRNNDHKQRYMERTIRQYETRAMGWRKAGNKNLYKHYKAMAKKWIDKYVKFSKKQDIAYYPSRIDI